MADSSEFTTPNSPTWCPGCGNHALWRAIRTAYAATGLRFEELAVVWGIGCHGNGADFTRCQGFHALHGRALPVATGLALSNPELKVVVEAGDGDCYGIGGNHFIHACRRNLDLTLIVHDNQVYGLTAGQASPTTAQSAATVSTPAGVLEEPVNALGLAIVQGATFVARGSAGDPQHLAALIAEAIGHRGFALVDVFQPCVTWNHLNTGSWLRERVYHLDAVGHDPLDRAAALALSATAHHELTCSPQECRIPLGVVYREIGKPTYADGLPQLTGPLWRNASGPRDISSLLEHAG